MHADPDRNAVTFSIAVGRNELRTPRQTGGKHPDGVPHHRRWATRVDALSHTSIRGYKHPRLLRSDPRVENAGSVSYLAEESLSPDMGCFPCRTFRTLPIGRDSVRISGDTGAADYSHRCRALNTMILSRRVFLWFFFLIQNLMLLQLGGVWA